MAELMSQGALAVEQMSHAGQESSLAKGITRWCRYVADCWLLLIWPAQFTLP